jgi:hypothetical protein
MDYTLENANRLVEELRAIPPKDPSKRKLDKQGMVRILANELVALQQRGYTIEEVAESLRGRGLEITTPTLKNYLQRTKSETDKRSKAPRRSMRPTATGAPNAARVADPQPAAHGRTKPEAPGMGQPPSEKIEAPGTAATEAGAVRSGKSAFLIKDKPSY